MIAGGGLGDVDADDVVPICMHAPNGVVDVVVADEAEAVAGPAVRGHLVAPSSAERSVTVEKSRKFRAIRNVRRRAGIPAARSPPTPR
jgi:hypothetical protein